MKKIVFNNLNGLYIPIVECIRNNDGCITVDVSCNSGCPFKNENRCEKGYYMAIYNITNDEICAEYIRQATNSIIDKVFKDYEIIIDEGFRYSMEHIISNNTCINGKCTQCGFYKEKKSCMQLRSLVKDAFKMFGKEIYSDEIEKMMAKRYLEILNENKDKNVKMSLNLKQIVKDNLCSKIFQFAGSHTTLLQTEYKLLNDSRTLIINSPGKVETITVYSNGNVFRNFGDKGCDVYGQVKIQKLLKPYWIEDKWEVDLFSKIKKLEKELFALKNEYLRRMCILQCK